MPTVLPRSVTQRRVVLTAVTLVCLLGAGAFYYIQANQGPVSAGYLVLSQGELLGIVEDPAEIEASLSALGESKSGVAVMDLSWDAAVEIEPIEVIGEIEYTPVEEIEAKLDTTLALMAMGYGIYVNGEAVVVLPTEDVAGQVLDQMVQEYRDQLEGPGVTVEEIAFLEQVEIRPMEVEAAEVVTPEKAHAILARGTDVEKTHTVQNGENLWTIAQNNGVGISDLRKANPEVRDTDVIKPGQDLSLVVPEPFINIASIETKTYIRSIPYSKQVVEDSSMWPWEQNTRQYGRAGEKEITLRVTRENGIETERQVLNEEILSEPVTLIVAVGTKAVPDHGTGTFIWPAQGTITSWFGWRWGGRDFHEGVDIAAPYGTPIKAADGGTVTFAGWRGGYGYCVIIDHGGGRQTAYGHCSALLVSAGQVVAKGAVIARMGSTGNSTGNHVHFETIINGKRVDPMQFFPN